MDVKYADRHNTIFTVEWVALSCNETQNRVLNNNIV